jgi:hypothetical protein
LSNVSLAFLLFSLPLITGSSSIASRVSSAAAASISESSTHSSNHGDEGAPSEFSHVPGYSSGASTPVDARSLDGSNHEPRDRTMSGNPKTLSHSNSVLGLDNMIEARKEEGDLMNNMVHIEVGHKSGIRVKDLSDYFY